MKKLVLFLATGCGIGLFVPFAPGTFGSLPGVALAWWMASWEPSVQALVALMLAAAAIPVCSIAERMLGVKDDGRITADEWMLYPIAVLGLPLQTLPVWALLVFFAVVRLVDIVKPPPARQLQAFHGGFGIVIDDFFANLYSLAINWTIYIAFIK
ncbi:MAG: phosphatidylglycerophosphatase A [Kiritimatiellae bacterium]|nr:phosphatidylglycerophosphatase A [Kiritimatiellia bacterium]